MKLSEVNLPEDADDSIREFAKGTPYTESEAEAILRFNRIPQPERTPSCIRNWVDHDVSTSDSVGKSLCDTLREELSESKRPKTVVESHPKLNFSSIYRHATGRCEHESDVPTTTTPRVRRDECRDMRSTIQKGKSIQSVTDKFCRSKKVVMKHIFGKCPHSFGTRYDGSKFTETDCNRVRRLYRKQGSTSMENVAAAFMISVGTAHRHLSGECDHASEESTVDCNPASLIDEEECSKMRSLFESGDGVPEIAMVFSRHATAVRRHVFGRCNHGGSKFDSETQVSEDRCNSIRKGYKRPDRPTIANLIDALNVTKGTFYYHLYGSCTHDPPEEPVERKPGHEE